MPVYVYRCSDCEQVFEKLLLSFNSDEVARTRCPACGATAPRDYASHTFASPSIGTTGELAEDHRALTRRCTTTRSAASGSRRPRPRRA